MAKYLQVILAQQRLEICEGAQCLAHYSVSTAKKGPGEQQGSECTPRGKHKIRAMIGKDCPSGSVFVGRRPTGEIYTAALGHSHPQRDWILSRILWLSGTEPGRNRYGEVDTLRRYIYFHGTPDALPMGTPDSHGCIRMRNKDIIELYEQVWVGMQVEIC